VIDLTSALWKERSDIDLDQVDGTYMVHICLADEIARIRFDSIQGGKYPGYAAAKIRRFLPDAPYSLFGDAVIPDRPYLRGPVDLSSINYGGRLTARGEVIRQERGQIAGLAWVSLGIRNREWTGDKVADAVVDRSPVAQEEEMLTPVPKPPYPANEAVMHIGATLYRQGEYGSKLFWGPSYERPDAAPKVWYDNGGPLSAPFVPSDSRWDVTIWPPMVVISVAEPLPPRELIAEYYDRVVIAQHGWNKHLLGASNGQSVATSIRTWAIALLMASGLTYNEASRVAHTPAGPIDQREVSQKVYNENKVALINRVDEAKDYI
jgi:hypothetical protein